MNKGVVAGAGLGLVLLAFLGGYWLANSGSAPAPAAGSASAPSPVTAAGPAGEAASSASGAASTGAPVTSAPAAAQSSAAEPASPVAGAPAPGAAGPSAAAPAAGGSRLTPEERRQLRASIRAKLAALQAKGPNVSIAEAQAVMDEVEQLGRGEFDPRYFKAVRDMLGYSGRVQTLSKELQSIASSSNAKDVARRQAILAEMRDLSDQISQSAAQVQSYARPLPAPAGTQK
ncbi:hypothetical protein [Hydrogenophaga luteola]|uniref:Uncharacterized protein n=1 Tax=Hydrogenophaga luteola TaxID=1591122 RepID=A0ABV7W981_9BURK